MRWMRAIPSFDSWRMTLASNSRSEIPRRAALDVGIAQPLLDQAQVAGQRLDVRQHERGRVVDLVRHAGGQQADRGQLLGLQAADLALALVGRVAHVEDGPPPRQRIGAHGEGPPAVRQRPIGAGAAGDRLARRRLQLPLQTAAVEPRADGVGDLQRAVGGRPGRRRPRTRRTSRAGRRCRPPGPPADETTDAPAARDAARRSRSRAPRPSSAPRLSTRPCQFGGARRPEPRASAAASAEPGGSSTRSMRAI